MFVFARKIQQSLKDFFFFMSVEYRKSQIKELGIGAFYCVDYQDLTEKRWVRNPFQTWEDVIAIMESLPYGCDHEGEQVPLFDNFRITPESYLSELGQKYDETEEKYVNDSTTNRQYILDERYENLAEKITGQQSLARKIKEPLDEYESRIREHTEEEESKWLLPSEESNTPYQNLQKKLVKDYRASNPAPSPFLQGNGTFREEMDGAEILKKQLLAAQFLELEPLPRTLECLVDDWS